MSAEKKTFVNVDELMPQLSVQEVAHFYGVELPELHQVGQEIRTRCFLACGKSKETGDRAVAIQASSPTKNWYCHQYGCGKSGNLVSLCDLLKPGDNAGGRPRGERFKAVAADLLAMTNGEGPSGNAPRAPAPSPAPEPEINAPLASSPNERARALTELDRKFTLELAAMPPSASSYFRRRPFLSPEVCRRWRLGYLPRDTGDDKSGGTMRGKVVYPYLGNDGQVLTWFGRDPDYEEKFRKWDGAGRTETEPEKFHFVKGFHRGLELFGQHRLREPEMGARLKTLGFLPLVEGPNDVIRLETLDVPAVGLCSNTITREQAEKVASLARELCGGVVLIFLDCDEQGENGMKQCLGYLAPLTPVRLAWMGKMFNGRFRGRQPESLLLEEWQEIEAYLRTGKADGWKIA